MKVFFLVMLALGCKSGERAEDVANSCGKQECPVGTAFAEYRAIREGIELGVGVDPKTYSGEVAFSHYGEGECTYTCETIAPCPADTFPVITAECYTCGQIAADGSVGQGNCYSV